MSEDIIDYQELEIGGQSAETKKRERRHKDMYCF
jgi:hypothetical protein